MLENTVAKIKVWYYTRKLTHSSDEQGIAKASEHLVGVGAPAIPEMEKLAIAHFKEEAHRLAAITILSQIGKPAIQMLISLLKGGHALFICTAAAEALGKIGDPSTVDALLAAFIGKNPQEKGMFCYSDLQQAALNALVQIGKPAVSQLIDVLQSKEYNFVIRAAAATAIGKIGDPLEMPALVNALSDGEHDVPEAAAEALVLFGKPAIPLFDELVKYPYTDAYRHAAVAYGKLDIQSALPILTRHLEHGGRGVRLNTANALGNIGSPLAISALIKALDDKDSDVAEAAAKALGKIGDPSAIPGLMAALRKAGGKDNPALAGAIVRLNASSAAIAEIQKWIMHEPAKRNLYSDLIICIWEVAVEKGKASLISNPAIDFSSLELKRFPTQLRNVPQIRKQKTIPAKAPAVV